MHKSTLQLRKFVTAVGLGDKNEGICRVALATDREPQTVGRYVSGYEQGVPKNFQEELKQIGMQA